MTHLLHGPDVHESNTKTADFVYPSAAARAAATDAAGLRDRSAAGISAPTGARRWPARAGLSVAVVAVPLLLVLAPPAAADAFADLARQANGAGPVTVLNDKWKRIYDEYAAAGNTGHVSYLDARWSGEIGVARHVVEHRGRRYRGWTALRVEDGKIVDMAWTDKPQGPVISGELGQAADLATTATALGQGLAEANPIVAGAGLPVAGVAKLAMPALIKRFGSFEACRSADKAFGALGTGAALYNIGAMAAAPAAGVIGAVAYGVWSSQYDAAFWRCIPKALRDQHGQEPGKDRRRQPVAAAPSEPRLTWAGAD